MKRYLQIEFLKIQGNNSFKIFSILFVVLLPLILFFLPTAFKDGIMGENTYPFLPKTATISWYYTAYLASWFSLFALSFIIVFHITNEYASKTVRQNIIDGYSKLDYLKSKFTLVIFMAVIATVYIFIVGLAVAAYFKVNQAPPVESFLPPSMQALSLPTEYGNVFDGVIFVLGYFLQILAYFILAVMVSVIVRKGALAVIIYFSLFFVELIFASQLGQALEPYVIYLPLHSFSSLVPFFKLESLAVGLTEVDALTWTNSLVSIAYMVIFILITKYVFNKRDVV